jgi:hypothetical protein
MTSKDILDYLSRPQSRWIMAGVVVVAALGLGGLMLAGGDDEARAAGGPGLSVAVVAPVEPDVAPGGVMDVGQLNNGFDGKLPEARPATDTTQQPPDDYYAEQPAYVEPRVQQMPPPRPGDEVHPYLDRESAPPPAPRPAPASNSGLFY